MAESFLTEDADRGLKPALESIGSVIMPLELALSPDAAGADLPWEVLSAMIQGRSSIDLTVMPVYSREEARELVFNYGFDLDQPEDAAEVESYIIEAINFIEHRFLTPAVDWEAQGEAMPPRERIPLAVTQSRSILDLLLLASQADHPHRAWACALLKVIHTLVYIQNSPLYKHHAQASESILSRFREVIQADRDGTVVMRGNDGRELRLFAFEAKHHKPRESILIKLLCKKENVAENVWDLVGVRLVTEHPAQAILAVDILRQQKVILFPNVIPSRSRNTLLDFAHFQALYEAQLAEYRAGRIPLEALLRVFETDDVRLPTEPLANQNPLSSPQYRSLHITCRQLLRVKSLSGLVETRFAFPYEIQIFDRESFLESKVGQGAHASYKQRQLFAARRRVLGNLLQAAPVD